MSVRQHKIDLRLRVLVYQDEGVYVAHALEMDLIGEGNSPNKAIEALRGAVEAQMSFAVQMDDPNLLDFEAPADIVERFDLAWRENLHDLASGDSPTRHRYQAEYLVIEGADLETLRKKAMTKRGVFQERPEPACA